MLSDGRGTSGSHQNCWVRPNRPEALSGDAENHAFPGNSHAQQSRSRRLTVRTRQNLRHIWDHLFRRLSSSSAQTLRLVSRADGRTTIVTSTFYDPGRSSSSSIFIRCEQSAREQSQPLHAIDCYSELPVLAPRDLDPIPTPITGPPDAGSKRAH